MIPAMANAHSHAFQRDLRGRRGAAASAATTTSGAGARRCTRSPSGSTPTRCARSPAACSARWRRPATAPSASSTTSTTARRHALRGAERDGARGGRRGAAAGLAIVLLPAAYRARRPSALPRTALLVRRSTFLARVSAARLGAALDVGVAAHSVRAVPADWLREIAAYADAHGLVRHVHAARAAARARGVPGRARLLADRAAARTGFLSDRTTVVHGIHVDERDVALLAETGTIVATCPTTEGNLGDGHFPALAYRDAGVRIAIGSDSNVRRRPVRGGPRAGDRRPARGLTRHALLAEAGDLWRAVARDGLASLGLEDAGAVTVDLDHPRLAECPTTISRARSPRARRRISSCPCAARSPPARRSRSRSPTRAPWSTASGCSSPAPPASTTRR